MSPPPSFEEIFCFVFCWVGACLVPLVPPPFIVLFLPFFLIFLFLNNSVFIIVVLLLLGKPAVNPIIIIGLTSCLLRVH
jgi:hypothetical protein